MIRVDNGPEFVSHKLDAWCKERGVTLAFIQPGSLTPNAYIFWTLGEGRQQIEARQHDYNHHRPHQSLGNRPSVDVLPCPPSL